MVNHFQALQLDDDQSQIEKNSFSSDNIGEEDKIEKRNSVRFLWRKMEKVITLLVIVYLIVLIFNLLSCKDTLPALDFPLPSQPTTLPNTQSSMHSKNSQKSKQSQLQDILEESVPSAGVGAEKQEATEITSAQATSQYQHIPSNQINQINQQSKTQNNQLANEHKASHKTAILFDTAQKQDKESFLSLETAGYANFISDYKDQKYGKQREQAHSQIRTIYEYLDDEHHRVIRSLPLENTKEIVNKYAEDSDSLLLHLIVQNSVLSTTLSQEDMQYLDYLTEQHLTGEPSQNICLILSAHNNAHNQQILRTLNSIYSQHYEPYQVVVAHRPNDPTSPLITNYLHHQGLASKTTLLQIDSESESYAAWTAAKACQEDSLAIYIDGNTELLGKEVFKMFNDYFAQFRANVVYSDYYSLDVAQERLRLVDSAEYDESEKFMLAYRSIPRKYGRMVGFKTNAIRHVPQSLIKFNNNHFEYSGIDSLAVTLLEMSCGKIKSIDEPLGLVLVDSYIQKQQEGKRKHEQRQISQKLKMDIC